MTTARRAMVRALGPDDLPTLFRLEHAYMHAIEPEHEQGWLRAAPENLRMWLNAMPTSAGITDDTGNLVGAAIWEHEHDVSTLITLQVDPTRRREGIASRLLGTFVAAAVANGATRAALGVHEANLGAAELYRVNGFTAAGRDGSYVLLERPLP